VFRFQNIILLGIQTEDKTLFNDQMRPSFIEYGVNRLICRGHARCVKRVLHMRYEFDSIMRENSDNGMGQKEVILKRVKRWPHSQTRYQYAAAIRISADGGTAKLPITMDHPVSVSPIGLHDVINTARRGGGAHGSSSITALRLRTLHCFTAIVYAKSRYILCQLPHPLKINYSPGCGLVHERMHCN
jgi:hypothetical protein